MKILLLSLIAMLPALAIAAPAEPSPIKVGLILPLSGPLAEYGVAVQNGITLAKSDSSDISKNCEFLVEDSKYDSNIAVSAFQKLSTLDKAPVIYNWGGPTSEAVSPLAARNNVAVFVWSADPSVSEGRPQVIRFANSGADYGGAMANYLKKKGYGRVGVVKTDNQYIEAIFRGLKASGETLQIEEIDSYQPGDQDFRATVSKLKKRNYDALGVFLLSGQVAQFVNQIKAQGISAPLFGTDFFESMTEVRQSHGGLVGAVFANNEVSPKFVTTYVKRFGNDLQINHAANGYDFANLLCKQLGSKLPGLSPLKIIEAFSNVTSFIGEQGEAPFTISARDDKYFRFPVVIRKIESDQIVTEREN